MKNIGLFIILFWFIGCIGQQKEAKKNKEDNGLSDKLKGDWEVHRKFDEQGNLVHYDSIYRYIYPNVEGDSVQVNLDSIMDSFRGYFELRSPLSWNDGFSYFPKTDSLFMKDFFKEDYFFNRWERQPPDMQEIMRKMDSSRNAFLRKYHPGLLESKEKD